MCGSLLRAAQLRSVFLGGVINGLLPCGLVYAYLALAAGSGDMLRGAFTMACFGLGTLPLMVATGCSGSLLSCGRRRQLLRLAACCVILTGVLTVARGISFMHIADPPTSQGCPLCD
jgi:sulfite exporter TauE/SafE